MIVCPVVLSAEVLALAVPLLSAIGSPICVLPSKNVTVPVGVPTPRPAAVTVAVKVTVWPETPGLMSLERAVALVDWLMACEKLALVWEVKLLSPL